MYSRFNSIFEDANGDIKHRKQKQNAKGFLKKAKCFMHENDNHSHLKSNAIFSYFLELQNIEQ